MQRLTPDFLRTYDCEYVELEGLGVDRETSRFTLGLLCPVPGWYRIQKWNQWKRLLHLGQPTTSLVRLTVSLQDVEVREGALLDAIAKGVLRLPLEIQELAIGNDSGEQCISLCAEELQLAVVFQSSSVEEHERLIDTSRVWKR
jgi:hypothetical protein